MNDAADFTYRWFCPNCGVTFEESDACLLEARLQSHQLACKPAPTGLGPAVSGDSKPAVKGVK